MPPAARRPLAARKGEPLSRIAYDERICESLVRSLTLATGAKK